MRKRWLDIGYFVYSVTQWCAQRLQCRFSRGTKNSDFDVLFCSCRRALGRSTARTANSYCVPLRRTLRRILVIFWRWSVLCEPSIVIRGVVVSSLAGVFARWLQQHVSVEDVACMDASVSYTTEICMDTLWTDRSHGKCRVLGSWSWRFFCIFFYKKLEKNIRKFTLRSSKKNFLKKKRKNIFTANPLNLTLRNPTPTNRVKECSLFV